MADRAMLQNAIDNYQRLVQLDMAMHGLRPQYPFRLNEQAVFTQHQVKLYQQNYCQKKEA